MDIYSLLITEKKYGHVISPPALEIHSGAVCSAALPACEIYHYMLRLIVAKAALI